MNKCVAAYFLYLWTLFACSSAKAEDWTTFGYDNRRSGVTREHLQLPLTESWIFKSPHKPEPAWPEPAKQDFWHHHYDLRATVTYDCAFHVVGAGDAVYFGSSADDKVYALDATTGQQRWTFFTEGPVRLAPTISGSRLYVGSDDGYVYCLSADKGVQIWRYKAADQDRMVPGNGRIISLCPVRTGLVVNGTQLYFAAGLFPEEGTFLLALNAEDGSVVWKQKVNVSPQGYILASDERLYVPTGRASPAMFARADGAFLGELPSTGGAYALLTEDVLVSGPGRGPKEISASDVKTKDKIATFAGLRMIVNGPVAYMQSESELSAFNRNRYLELSRQKNSLSSRYKKIEEELKKLTEGASQAEQLRKESREIAAKIAELSKQLKDCFLWTVVCECPYSMIMAGDILFAGGDNKVAAHSATSGKEIWSAPVTGKAFGLSIINGGLYVSTDTGQIHCFRNKPDGTAQVIVTKPTADPYPPDDLAQLYTEAAKNIVEKTQVRKGYCLILNCGDGRLAYELARLTDLKIIAVEDDASKVSLARNAIDKAGLYGRVVVHHRRSTELPYTKYFANLIVCQMPLRGGELPSSVKQIFEVLRPYGGVIALPMPAGKYDQENLENWGGDYFTGWKVHKGNKTVLAWATRKKLKGAGEWTHTYAEPGNTACSEDELVKGEVSVQWFGEPGPRQMIDRHHRNVPPLFKNGRLFVPGDCIVFAVDAYNGTALWEVQIPNSRRLGVFLDCGSMVVDGRFLYVVAEDRCHRFDVQTGRRHLGFVMPQLVEDEPRDWGYIAYTGNLLLGSGCKKEASYTETSYQADDALWHRNMKLVLSDYLFAMEKGSGAPLWKYRDGLIVNTTIALGGGRMYFLQTHSPKALADRLGRMPAKELFDGGEQHLVALDAQTGEVLYSKRIDTRNLEEPVYLNYAMDTLLLSGSKLDGQVVRYYYYAFDAKTGEILWSTDHDSGLPIDGGHGEYNRCPTIVGDTVFAWPYAYNLRTGAKVPDWKFDRRGHGCGGISASAQCLFWRGANPWMYDLGPNGGPTRLNSVTRPGCWINIIPAGGLILIPEASSGCTCGFALQTSIAYVPDSKKL
jgi:outer membrane protein assembly factor BamB